MTIFVMKATFEKNATDGIEHYTDPLDLAEAVLDAYDTGATGVQVFRCVEVSFDAYRCAAVIEIGNDKEPKT